MLISIKVFNRSSIICSEGVTDEIRAPLTWVLSSIYSIKGGIHRGPWGAKWLFPLKTPWETAKVPQIVETFLAWMSLKTKIVERNTSKSIERALLSFCSEVHSHLDSKIKFFSAQDVLQWVTVPKNPDLSAVRSLYHSGNVANCLRAPDPQGPRKSQVYCMSAGFW